MPTIRTRKDLQDFAETIIPCPDRFPEWFNEPRSDLSSSSFRDALAAESWVAIDAAIDALEIAGEDTITAITAC